MSLVDHYHFRIVKPYVSIEMYARDSSKKRGRFRIGLRGAPPSVQAAALAMRMVCVHCRTWMNPFRQSQSGGKPKGEVYFAATCPLRVNLACSRSKAATAEYKAVRAAVEGVR